MADNVAIVERAYEALTQGDIDTFLDTLDGQVEWHLPNITRSGRARHSWYRRRFSKVTSVGWQKSMMVYGSISIGCWSRCGDAARER